MRILINTISTKKTSGGAFQIAYNFLMKTLEHPEVEWLYVTSMDLDAIIGDELKRQPNYFVFPTQPDFKHTYKRVKKELAELEERLKPDVVYSITAPSYFSFKTSEVMRFTNPTVAHPNKYSWKVLPLKGKLRLVAYSWNQKRLIRKANYFVTQTETTKKGILRITGLPEKNVCVVKNVLPTVFASTETEHIETNDNRIHIACVGAPVPHKNFDIIPDVLSHLKEKGIENACFHVTIPEGDPMMAKIEAKIKANGIDSKCVQNHGRMPQKELVEMYRRCSLCFLPTLLEVFSVSTLEAMFFDLKIVATDFAFNTEVLDNAALYYEPMNAKDAADKFAQLIGDKELQTMLSVRMKERLALFDNYDNHFNAIKDFLVKVGKGKCEARKNRKRNA